MQTITPLKKHGSQHGGLIAALLLVVTSAVVWTTHPREPSGPADQRAAVRSAAAAVPATERARPTFELRQPIATMAVTAREVRRQATGAGVTAYDETRTSHVVAPVHGWLEKPRATWLGRKVRPGEPLAVMYSLEVYLATAYLVAQVRTFESQAKVDAARQRLARWSMPRPNFERIESRLAPEAALPLVSRVAGTVVADHGTSRQFVEPAELFTITDPARAWAFVELPAADAARVQVGMPATLTIDGVTRPLTARVSYVWRRAENGMRTVRFDIYSPRVALAPNTPVSAALQLDAERLPVIPVSAVSRVDGKSVVYVVRGTAVEPREVTLGSEQTGSVSVVTGLAAGETIAVDAARVVASGS